MSAPNSPSAITRPRPVRPEPSDPAACYRCGRDHEAAIARAVEDVDWICYRRAQPAVGADVALRMLYEACKAADFDYSYALSELSHYFRQDR